ncbi:MAG: hypothetical protein ACPGWR_16540, partial [Ardenticatenaceae bacterium]
MFIIIAIATSYVSAMAGQAMLDTFSVISTSISTAMAPLNYAGSMPAGGVLGGGPLQAGASLAGAAVTGGTSLAATAAKAAVTGGANIAGTAALAGVTGGGRAALMAGGGALIGQVSQRGGQMAGEVATGMMGERASVFATAAQGKEAGTVARVAGSRKRRQRQEKEKAEEAAGKKFSSQSKAPEDEIPEAEQNFLNAGSCLTADPEDLRSAEQAFEKGRYTTARHHLTRAFGSREVANQAMKQYREHGRKGMKKVRDMTVAAQTTALTLTTDSQPLFDGEGGLTSDFQKQTWDTLKKSESVDTTSQEDAALAGQIAGATVREPTDIWRDPFAPHQLAQHINQNPEDEHPYSQDAAAAFALHDMANSQGWGEQQLEALFEAAREARALELSGKQVGIDAIAQRMNMHGEFADSLPGTNREAARLAMLILGQTKASKPEKRTLPTAEELAQKTLHPDTPQVIPDLEITEEAINDLNDLAAEEGWQEDELTIIFNAALTARQTPLERGDTYVDVMVRDLAATKEFLMTPTRTREKAARLALRMSAGAKLDPSSKKATKPKAGATAQAPAAQAPAAQVPAAQVPATQAPDAQAPAAQAPAAQVPAKQGAVTKAAAKQTPETSAPAVQPAWWDQGPPPREWDQGPPPQAESELAPPPQAGSELAPTPQAGREQAPTPQAGREQAPLEPPSWDQEALPQAGSQQAPPSQPWNQAPPESPALLTSQRSPESNQPPIKPYAPHSHNKHKIPEWLEELEAQDAREAQEAREAQDARSQGGAKKKNPKPRRPSSDQTPTTKAIAPAAQATADAPDHKAQVATAETPVTKAAIAAAAAAAGA